MAQLNRNTFSFYREWSVAEDHDDCDDAVFPRACPRPCMKGLDAQQIALSRYLASPQVAAWLLEPQPVKDISESALQRSFVYAIAFGNDATPGNPVDDYQRHAHMDIEDMLIVCNITSDNFALGVVYGLAQAHIFAKTPLMSSTKPVSRKFAVDLNATNCLEFMELVHFDNQMTYCCFRQFLHTLDQSLPVTVRATLHAPAALQLSQQSAVSDTNGTATNSFKRPLTSSNSSVSSNPSASLSGNVPVGADVDSESHPVPTFEQADNSLPHSEHKRMAADKSLSPKTQTIPPVDSDFDQFLEQPVTAVTPDVLGPVIMRAEAFEAVTCPACGLDNYGCMCMFEEKSSVMSKRVSASTWNHFTSLFMCKARHGKIRLTLYAAFPIMGEVEIMSMEVNTINVLLQGQSPYMDLLRTKAIHDLGINVVMPRLDSPLLSSAIAMDFLNMHNAYVTAAACKKRSLPVTASSTDYIQIAPCSPSYLSQLNDDQSAFFDQGCLQNLLESTSDSNQAGVDASLSLLPRLVDNQAQTSAGKVSPLGLEYLSAESQIREPHGLSKAGSQTDHRSLDAVNGSRFAENYHSHAGSSEHRRDVDSAADFLFSSDVNISENRAHYSGVVENSADSYFHENGQELLNSNAGKANDDVTPFQMIDNAVPLATKAGNVADKYASGLDEEVSRLLGNPSQFAGPTSSVAGFEAEFSECSSKERRCDPIDMLLEPSVHGSADPLRADLDNLQQPAGGPRKTAVSNMSSVSGAGAGSETSVVTNPWLESTDFNLPETSYAYPLVDKSKLQLIMASQSQPTFFEASRDLKRTRAPPTSVKPSGCATKGFNSEESDRKHECIVCSKRFKIRGDLQRHIRVVHMKEKSFVCKECGKAFGHSGHLNRHMASHRNDRRFHCELCGYSFFQASHLASHKEHIHSASNGRNHECSWCRLRVSSVDELQEHLDSIHRVRNVHQLQSIG